MARSSRARGNRGGGGGGGRRQAAPKATSRKSAKKAAPVAEVEVVEEKKGMGIEDGLPIMTTIILLAAFLMTDYLLGTEYGGGIFFKG